MRGDDVRRGRELEAAVKAAADVGLSTYDIAQRLANGLTGQTNGYRERAIARAFSDAYDAVVDVPIADLKAAEQRGAIARLDAARATA